MSEPDIPDRDNTAQESPALTGSAPSEAANSGEEPRSTSAKLAVAALGLEVMALAFEAENATTSAFFAKAVALLLLCVAYNLRGLA